MATEAPSKAFRARMALCDHELRHVQKWASANCALHAIFRNAAGTAILIGLRDHARTSASFARSLRCALLRMGVASQALRGKWCFLISEREAIVLCGEPTSVISREALCAEERDDAGAPSDEGEARVVDLLR